MITWKSRGETPGSRKLPLPLGTRQDVARSTQSLQPLSLWISAKKSKQKSIVCVHGTLSSPRTQQHPWLDHVQLVCTKADLAHNFKNIPSFSTGLFAGLARLFSELLVPITCPSHPPSFAVMLLFFPLMP